MRANPERIVFHFDLDAFFATVEVLCNPSLRGRPLIVGGMPEDRGVVSTASYEARAFGVRSGQPLAEAARRCPQAIFIPCHPAPYVWYSTRVLKLLLERTPRVELFSIDEAFLDGSDLCRNFKRAAALAEELSAEVERRFGLTGSFGIGPNKLVAKMASKLRKPRGITLLTAAEFREVFWPKPVGALYGIGPATALALERMGIATVGALARADPEALQRRFGVVGPALVASAHGLDQSPVIPYGEGPPPKSIGHEYTFERDERDRCEVDRLLLSLSERVGLALRREGRAASTVHLKLRWYDFTTTVRQDSLEEATDSSVVLLRHARSIFRRFDTGGAVRLVGLAVSSLTPPGECWTGRIASLFAHEGRVRSLEGAADLVRDRFGDGTLRRAGELSGKAVRAPRERASRVD